MEIEQPKVRILLPGEPINVEFDPATTKVNANHFQVDARAQTLVSKNAGILLAVNPTGTAQSPQKAKKNVIQLLRNTFQYYPEKEDFVIGVVRSKNNDFYTLDIGASSEAVLPLLDFEGATKKNRPNLDQGQLVYCRVVENNKFLRPRVSCINPHSKKEWTSGEAFFGELKDGMSAFCGVQLCRSLVNTRTNIKTTSSNDILKTLQKYVQFEVAVGVNGRLWIKCADASKTMLALNCIRNSATLAPEHAATMV